MIFEKAFYFLIFQMIIKTSISFIFYNNELVCLNTAEKITHLQAESLLRIASIEISSVGDCTSRNNTHCTSFEQIMCSTIRGIIGYRKLTKCQVIITGGTEIGHENEEYSHFDGFRINIDLNECHDKYIKTNFDFIGKLKNGASQWQDACRNVFRLEGNHWNIFFNNET